MKRILLFLKIYVFWLLTGVVSKILFLLIYTWGAEGITWIDRCKVLLYGCRLDAAVAAYLSVLPGLWLTFIPGSWQKVSERCLKYYCSIFSVVYVTGIVVNLALYNYWRFPLDTAPLLYIKTSPADAFASISICWLMGGILLIALLSLGLIYCIYRFIRQTVTMQGYIYRVILLCLTAALIIPIRGGFETGTNHTGSVYFTNNMLLNHAAVNPVFSFIESSVHSQNIAERYRYMEEKKADSLFQLMTFTSLRNNVADSTSIQDTPHPDVVMIILESFSRYIMSGSGHVKGVTPCLDKLSTEGLYFDHFYANSFRTDRALVSILSGFPAQPTMSIMEMPNKSTTLPSIAQTLKENGYATFFYYGGDTNYSNMQSYFMGTGFEHIISIKDFPQKAVTGKWGVADGPVLNRMLQDQTKASSNHSKPYLSVIMTESSHEPFDVPHYNKLKDPTLNAFAYADSCLGDYMNRLKKLPSWRNTLVVIVPDHLGAYPHTIDNYALWRYQLPLIITGGVVNGPKVISTIGGQTDIAATLLSLLKIEHKEFLYSKDLLDESIPHFAFFTLDDGMGLITDSTQIIYDNHAKKLIVHQGKSPQSALEHAKAYLQKLYNDIAERK